MYGYIYKTTINNPKSDLHNYFYIGQNKSEYVVESYYGSGPTFESYCREYMHQKHCKKISKEVAEALGLHREILAYADSMEELNELEEGFVNPELSNPLCLNKMAGGVGYETGGVYNIDNEQREKNLQLTQSTDEEVFVDLPSTKYQVSNFGRIRNKDTGHVNTHYVKNRVGYIRAELFDGDGNKKRYFIHRLVASAFIPNNDPENKIQVNHKDGDRTNNRADNLEWVTRSENMQHCFHVTKRKIGFGYGFGKSNNTWNKGLKLKELRPEIIEKRKKTLQENSAMHISKKNFPDRDNKIIELFNNGSLVIDIAKEFGLSRKAIKRIIKLNKKD